MDFATSLGSKIIITNAAPSDKKELFFESVDDLIHHAESLGLTIGLENPGDGSDNLVNSAKEGAILIRKIGSKFLKMNYDFGNPLSHLQGRIRPEDDFLEGLDAIVHLHIKDVQRSDLGWEFTAIGDGEIDYARVFEVLKDWHLLYPISLEVPLRISRNTNASPRRKKNGASSNNSCDVGTISTVCSNGFSMKCLRWQRRLQYFAIESNTWNP